ncbi:uncharacterized protein ACR2FA_005952 [Aphomia sociella]
MESEWSNSIETELKNDTFTKGKDIIDFVREVKKRPCLYDNTQKEYSNAAFTKPAWREIASKLNTTVIDCKEKWRKIRVAFMRSVKQLQSDNPPNRPYWLADHLQFLLPFMQMYLKSGDKLKIITPPQVRKKEDDELNDNIDKILNSSNITKMTDPPRGIKRHQDSTEYTPRKMFLLSLLPEVESFSEQEMRIFRRNVVNLMDDILNERDLKIAPITQKLTENRVRWYGHVKRRSEDHVALDLPEQKKGRSRPPLTWWCKIQRYLKEA